MLEETLKHRNADWAQELTAASFPRAVDKLLAEFLEQIEQAANKGCDYATIQSIQNRDAVSVIDAVIERLEAMGYTASKLQPYPNVVEMVFVYWKKH